MRDAPLVACAIALAACSAQVAGEGRASEHGATSGPSDRAAPAPAPSGSTRPRSPIGDACTLEKAPRHLAFLRTGTCGDVPADAGQWTGTALFPDAPSPLREVACAFDWSSDVGAAPEPSALAVVDAEHLVPTCPKRIRVVDVTTPVHGEALEVPPMEADGGGTGAPSGVTGCDVCARLVGRELFVILPPDQLDLKRIAVWVDSGAEMRFDVSPSVAGAQAFFVSLPPPTEGAYVGGRVSFFER